MRKKLHFLFLFVLANLVYVGANAQLLLQEGFEGTFPPSGWTLTNNGAGNSWTQNTAASYAYAGSKSMQCLYNFANPADAWAFTPALSLTTAPVLITFYVRTRSATYTESLKLTIGNDIVIANHTNVLLDSASLKNLTFQKWEVTYIPSSAGTYYLGFNCYSIANQWNVFIDNLTVQSLSACSGKPNAGIVTGPSAVCSGQTINVSDSGATFGTGISYQWQNSIDNGATWSAISGATSNSYSTSITDTTLFRYVATCSNSGDTAISNVVKVGLNGVLICAYCSPNNGTTLHNGTSPSIDLVSISGTSLNNAGIGVPTDGYSFFPPSQSTTANLTQSLTYNLTTNLSGASIVSVWFDWNQDGVYDASEWTQITTTGTGSITTPIQVPSNASLGSIGMRIRSRASGNTNAATDACTSFGSGETEDYVVNIVAGVLCTGTPTGGIASGPSSICSGANFTIKDSGSTAASGITYQWQSSIDNGTTWTDVIGATNASYVGSITDTTWFRFKVTCTGSGSDGFSNIIKVGLNATLVCAYCSPNNGTTLHSFTDPTIESVSISGTSLSNANVGAPTNGYTQFPASGSTTTTLSQALTYNLITNFSGASTVSVWFDWNQDGTYDSTEWTLVTAAGSGVITTPILVPANSSLGQIGMRIRSRTSGATNGPNDACTTFGSGETEEYLITIIPGTACTGTPTGGVASGPSSVCSGTNFIISDSGATAAVGITYQWQSSIDNGANWTDITGATSYSYTGAISDTTWFRFKATCTNSSTDGYSNSIKVGLNGTLVCAYCSPLNGTTLHNGTVGPIIQAVSITGTTLSNANTVPPSGGYTQFPASGNTTTILTQALTYNLVTTLSATGTAYVWFDWNQDGVYDATEAIQITASGTGAITTSIVIPANATLGQIGMRVRSAYTFDVNGPAAACSTFFAGETEEYLVTIAAGVACTGTPNGGIASGPTSICGGIAFNLTDSAYTSASGIAYQWQSSIDNGATWTDVTGATSAKYSATITDTTWFRFKVTCTNSNLDGYSNVIKVGLNGILVCAYCSPNNGTTLHSATGPTIESVSITGTTLNSANVGTPTNGYSQFPAGGSTTATLTQALTYNLVTNLSGGSIVSVWFDWNQDGVYDASEWTQITTTSSGIITTPILVPTSSSIGQIGMRVRARTSGATNGATDACTTFGSGETEEYLVTIAAGVACTGTPTGGYANSASTSVCSGSTVIISDSGATAASGITYQWQSSLDNGATWTDITGATSATYTATIADTTWFRFKVTCTSTSLDGYSNVVKVGLNAALLCAYCGPNTGVTLHGGTSPTIDSVSITGTTLSNKSVGAPTNGYSQFSASGKTTAVLAQLGTYNLVIKVSGSAIASVWIDYNQNGIYDATEWKQITTTGTGVITTSITIPDTATLGLTGLRIRLRGAGSANGPTNACTQFFSGETEEYFVTIDAPLPVKLASFIGTHKTIGNVLSWTTLGEQNNTGFKVERSFDGKNFTVVGFVKTAALNGNSSEAINYQFNDEKPFNNSYYRLRQLDKDGKESYSKVVLIKMLNSSELSLMSLYPNPAKNIINLVISGNVDEKVTLVVTDFAGKIVRTQNATLSNSSNIITLDIATLTSGNYLLKVIGKEGTNSAFGKFFKQ